MIWYMRYRIHIEYETHKHLGSKRWIEDRVRICYTSSTILHLKYIYDLEDINLEFGIKRYEMSDEQ